MLLLEGGRMLLLDAGRMLLRARRGPAPGGSLDTFGGDGMRFRFGAAGMSCRDADRLLPTRRENAVDAGAAVPAGRTRPVAFATGAGHLPARADAAVVARIRLDVIAAGGIAFGFDLRRGMRPAQLDTSGLRRTRHEHRRREQETRGKPNEFAHGSPYG